MLSQPGHHKAVAADVSMKEAAYMLALAPFQDILCNISTFPHTVHKSDWQSDEVFYCHIGDIGATHFERLLPASFQCNPPKNVVLALPIWRAGIHLEGEVAQTRMTEGKLKKRKWHQTACDNQTNGINSTECECFLLVTVELGCPSTCDFDSNGTAVSKWCQTKFDCRYFEMSIEVRSPMACNHLLTGICLRVKAIFGLRL